MIYKLKNDKYQIEVDSLGAQLTSFLLDNEQYLYQRDTKYWHRSSPVLFPIVGRVKHNKNRYNNKTYRLPIHGFARFNQFELISKTHNSLSFRLKENNISLKYYPFQFELILSYFLSSDGLKINYQVSTNQEEIYFSLGAHPAFLLKAAIQDSFFTFEKNEKKDAIALNLDTACICDEKSFTLLGNFLKLGKDIFSKDALIFKDLNSKKVTLNNSKNQKSITMDFTNFEYIAFWAPVGAPFVCIEPWCGVADNINTNHNFKEKQSIIKISKNQTFDKSLFISLN